MSAPIIRAVLVEPNPVLAEQLRRDLWGHPVLTVAAVRPTAEEAAVAAEEAGADVFVADVNAVGGLAGLAAQLPTVAIVPGDGTGGLDALSAGVVDLWPRSGDVTDLAWRACAAANADVARLGLVQPTRATDSADGLVLAIGAGTGGMSALAAVLIGLPADAAGVVVTPLPAGVVPAWAERIDRYTDVRLAVAADGERLAAGRVLIASGDGHVTLRAAPGRGWAVVAKDGPAVHHARPSLDVLFQSAAAAGPRAVAAVVGGAGPDGVAGLLAVRRAGGRTVVESPETAVCPDRPTRCLRSAAAAMAATADRLAATMVDAPADLRPHRAA